MAGAPRRVTVGVAAAVGPEVRELYARADEALYDAKRSGGTACAASAGRRPGATGPGTAARTEAQAPDPVAAPLG